VRSFLRSTEHSIQSVAEKVEVRTYNLLEALRLRSVLDVADQSVDVVVRTKLDRAFPTETIFRWSEERVCKILENASAAVDCVRPILRVIGTQIWS